MPPVRRVMLRAQRNVFVRERMRNLSLLICACAQILLDVLLSPNSQLFSLLRSGYSAPFFLSSAWRGLEAVPRMYWRYPGRSDWFSQVVLQLWDQSMWIQNFRMTKQTLFEIADELRPHLLRKDTVMRSAISVEERVAIGVYFLASKSCYRSIGLIFCKGKSSVASIVVEFCLAMEMCLLNKVVVPTNHHKVMADFQRLGFPNCIGAIDGCHIPICAPKLQSAQYYNRKSFHSVVLQAVAEADGIFSSILIGHSGVSHDAHIFRSSSFYQRMQEGTFIDGNPSVNYGFITIPPLILGDGAYPLSKWLMKAYANPVTEKEKYFNKVLNRSRNCVERSFGLLKSRFKRLSVRMDVHIQNVNSVIAAAVILHNICERKKHQIPNYEPATLNRSVPLGPVPPDFDDSLVPNAERTAGEAVRCAVTMLIANVSS